MGRKGETLITIASNPQSHGQIGNWIGARQAFQSQTQNFSLNPGEKEGRRKGDKLGVWRNLRTHKIKIIKVTQNQWVQIFKVPPKRSNVFQTKSKKTGGQKCLGDGINIFKQRT